ncbi:conjugal transfer transcriptional regulator TraJ [Klebsiella pneumoniae]|nr:conjugal transfer transcriptional regulator TraJ [Klebsiella pneumoniae]
MCAKDRSHIAVRSQTDSIHSMREMLNISSCPAFIRDSRGEVIHTSPTFDKIFLTSGGTGAFDTPRAPGSWFLDLSLEIKLELMQSELKSFSEGSAVLVKNIWLAGSLWTVFIETFSINEDTYSKWHCCKVSDEAAFCLIQRPYISKTLLTRRISPRGSP